jgi:hypothetical protein
MTTPTSGSPYERARQLAEEKALTDRVKIFIPGVFDPDTFEQLPDTVIWEGPGAIRPDTRQDLNIRLDDGQGTVVGEMGAYRLLTPLAAPTAPSDAVVTFTACDDDAAIGRRWSVDSVERGSHQVLRTTWLTYETTANDGS